MASSAWLPRLPMAFRLWAHRMPGNSPSADILEPAIRLSQQNYEKMAEFVTRELGIKMPASKKSMVQSRLLRRVRELGMQSLDEYCEYLFSPPHSADERVHFIDAMTTNKTDFFREPKHFDYLTQKVLPELEGTAVHKLKKKITVWSAACSTGEEPYTLAMIMSEYALTRPQFDFQILSTDISTRVLLTAKDGIYSRHQIEPVPRELRRRYLLNGKGEYRSLVRVRPELRRRVSFHQLNFMDEDYRVKQIFDIVFCRNVLIYFDRATQESVIGKICRNLVQGGYLFISHSESLSGLNLPLTSVGASCFQKQEGL
jgi:chemotaxis protein methyltransferase CheR